MSGKAWWISMVVLVGWATAGVAQLEYVVDQNIGPRWMAPGATAVVQAVWLKDADDDSHAVKLKEVNVSNLGNAPAAAFALIEVLDGTGNVLASKSDPKNFPVTLNFPDITIADEGEYTLQIRVELKAGITDHPTIQFRLTIKGEEPAGKEHKFEQTVDDGASTTIDRAPVAQDDSYTTDEDTPVSGNVLANDSDPDNDPLTAKLVSGPSNGTLTLNEDGSFTYTPNPNFFGTDSFTYQASDGTADSDVATVTITVNPVDDPVDAVDDLFDTEEGKPVSGNVLANDSYPDGFGQVDLVSAPSNGFLNWSGDGTFTYTPKSNWCGTDSFTYRLYDADRDWDTATVTITVAPRRVFEEDFEDDAGWTKTGLWHIRTADPCIECASRYISGAHAQYSKPETCSYDTRARTQGILTSPIITIFKNSLYSLQFDYARLVENNPKALLDKTFVQIRFATVRIVKENEQLRWTSWRTIWAKSSRDPSPDCGQFVYHFRSGDYERIQIRFVFDSVNHKNNNFAGWAIDNVVVKPSNNVSSEALEMADIGLGWEEPAETETLTVVNTPNPVRDVHTTTFTVLGVEAEAVRVEVYDLAGRLVWKAEALGNELVWHTEDLTGLPLANGVYLYIAYVKVDGEWIRLEPQKLVILR